MTIHWADIISDEDLVEMYRTKSLTQVKQAIGKSRYAIRARLLKIGVTMRAPDISAPFRVWGK